MATGTGTILELRLEAEGLSGWITCPVGMRPAPGQYLVASRADPAEPLPVVLFASRWQADFAAGLPPGQSALRLAPPLPAAWSTGLQLALRGPLGRGFHLPGTARRVALASLDGAPHRLLPLAELALQQRAAVALYASAIPDGLPEEVEVLPLELLPEAPAWADYLALEAHSPALASLRARLGLQGFQRLGCPAQVLVLSAMPCSGLAECGVCAVATRGGWKLACVDGPVFDFNQLEGS